MNDQSTTGVAQLEALKNRLETLQRELAAERQRTQRSTVFMAVVAAILLIVLGGYFYYGYTQIANITRPEKVVDVAQGVIDERLPEARSSLEAQIIKSAPTWAEGLSKQAQEALPQARQRATEQFLKEADRMTQEASVLSEEHFRTFLRENRPLLDKKFQELSKSPDLAEESLQELQKSLETQLGGEMNADAKALSKDIASAAVNLQRLGSDEKLTPEQKVERRVWMIARRLQMDAQGSEDSTSPSAIRSTDTIKTSTGPAAPARKTPSANGAGK